MLTQLTTVQVWVHDQEEALAFYTEKLGLELRDDVTIPELGNFRWVTVGVPGQKDVAIVLMAVPGPPVFDEETRKQIQALVAKGAATGLFFATDDIHGTYEELKGRGVQFQQEPTEQPYGIDAGFRDPSGNSARLVQRSN
jgi:catechol 2,3-dioxygenase-like lactoylglutathione lyase family enzyme